MCKCVLMIEMGELVERGREEGVKRVKRQGRGRKERRREGTGRKERRREGRRSEEGEMYQIFTKITLILSPSYLPK